MTEQPSIFSEIDDAKIQATKKRLHKKILTGQVISLIVSIILVLFIQSVFRNQETPRIIAIIISLCFPLMSLFSFKWSSHLLTLYSIVFSLLILTIVAGIITHLPEDRLTLSGLIIFVTVFTTLDIFIVRGAIAATKYTQLNKRP